ncbi:MAG TPA: hypothetical protein PK135_04090 [Arenimonas sp.]|nr:hypothetical protein [Arenimonas sp.]
MKLVKKLIFPFFLTAFSIPLFAAVSDGEQAFKKLNGLVGNWIGKSGSGREHRVNYRLTAGDTVLVETWSLSSGRESMTLYHLDGESLIATHYCPQGNQPRLVLMPGDGAMHFAFLDGTNLQVPGKSHQYSFWLKIKDEGHFQRNEIYIENGTAPETTPVEDPKETFSYMRADTSSAATK